MGHLRPVSHKDAPEDIQELYSNMLQTLDVEMVPLFFQYIANYPAFLSHTWDKISNNIHADTFALLQREVSEFSRLAVKETYKPSEKLTTFIHKLEASEKKQLLDTTSTVQRINTILLIIGLGIRESIKGVFVGQQLLASARMDIEPDYFVKQFSSYDTNFVLHKKDSENIAATTDMLVPLFGQQAIALFRIPTFYELMQEELNQLQNTEKYLAKRVGLEKTTLSAVERLPYSLGTSYQELIRLAGNKPYFPELLFLLIDTFPSSFPRMLLATAMMESALLL